MNLSGKELSYLKDSLGQEQQLVTKCNDYAGKVQCPELKSFLTQLACEHQQNFNQLYQQVK